MLESLFNKVAGFMPVTLLKRGPSTGAKYKIFNSTFFKEYLWAPFSRNTSMLLLGNFEDLKDQS